MRPDWQKVCESFTTRQADLSLDKASHEWRAALPLIRQAFCQSVGEQLTAERFCVPADYLVFMAGIGSRPDPMEDLDADWFALWNAEEMTERTTYNCRFFAGDRGKHGEEVGLWLNIAKLHDHQAFFLGCELGHPLFGTVIGGLDAHPWLNGFGPMLLFSPTFRDFLRDYLPVLSTLPPDQMKRPVHVWEWLKVIPPLSHE
jgi:hypothetical protein